MANHATPLKPQTQQHPLYSVGNKGGMTSVLAPADIKEAAATNGFKESEDMPIAGPIDEFRASDNDF